MFIKTEITLWLKQNFRFAQFLKSILNQSSVCIIFAWVIFQYFPADVRKAYPENQLKIYYCKTLKHCTLFKLWTNLKGQTLIFKW